MIGYLKLKLTHCMAKEQLDVKITVDKKVIEFPRLLMPHYQERTMGTGGFVGWGRPALLPSGALF